MVRTNSIRRSKPSILLVSAQLEKWGQRVRDPRQRSLFARSIQPQAGGNTVPGARWWRLLRFLHCHQSAKDGYKSANWQLLTHPDRSLPSRFSFAKKSMAIGEEGGIQPDDVFVFVSPVNPQMSYAPWRIEVSLTEKHPELNRAEGLTCPGDPATLQLDRQTSRRWARGTVQIAKALRKKCLFSHGRNCNAPPSIPASTSVETRPSGGDRFQLWVSAVGSMPGSGSQVLSYQGLHPRLQERSRGPRPPSLLLFWVLPIGCLWHLRTEEVKGVSKWRPPPTSEPVVVPEPGWTRGALTAASLSVLQFVIPACWQAQNPGGQWIWPHLSCIYTLLFTRKPITLSELCKNPPCCQ